MLPWIGNCRFNSYRSNHEYLVSSIYKVIIVKKIEKKKSKIKKNAVLLFGVIKAAYPK